MNMLGAFIGIKSFSQKTLASYNKITLNIPDTIEYIEEIHDHLSLLGFLSSVIKAIRVRV